MRRVLLVLAGLLAVVIVGVAVFSFVTVHRSFPDTTGRVQISALDAEVAVKRDGHGIPQIYADTPEDLFLAQGYVHAQDRFREMDVRRHVTAGRLSELVGAEALGADRLARTLGWRRVAQRELAQLDDETLRLVNAYARGVNAYIEDRSGSELSLEYSVPGRGGSGYTPEPWTAVDSLTWIKAMAWGQGEALTDEIDRVASTGRLTADQVAELYPGETPGAGDDTGLAQAAVGRLADVEDDADALTALLGTGGAAGSNAWVVGGDLTATGEPILANESSLAPSMPGPWYQMGLHCRTVDADCPYDVAGSSFSGLPGVVAGHTSTVAWGVAARDADVADLYLERVTGDTYEDGGRQVPLETRQETFEVAGGEPVTTTVRSTRHGPILSDPGDDPGDVQIALRWTALDPRPAIKGVLALGRMQDWDDFRAAAKQLAVPAQHLVYADVDGHIGHQASGTTPVRATGDGRWPVAGWDPARDWSGSVPFDELSSVLDPAEGFVVGADDPSAPRPQRLRELLDGRDDLTVADLSRLQNDTYNANAARLVPELLRIELGSAYHRQGQATLRRWDSMQDADSPGAAYFNAVWRNLLVRTFHDELPKDRWPDGGERWYRVVDSILDRPGSHWWDDVTTSGTRETRDDVLAAAMRDARDELTMIQSRSPGEWRWGTMHTVELVNPTAGTGLAAHLFDRGPYRLGGGPGIVAATAWDAREGYEVTAVPSMRMVVDLADLDRSRWIQLTGSSGHAFHGHYADQREAWSRGETLPWVFGDDAVDEATDDVLTLSPTP